MVSKMDKPRIFAGWPGAIGRTGPLEFGLDAYMAAGVTGARIFFWHIWRPRFPYKVTHWENDRPDKKGSIPTFVEEWDETFFDEARIAVEAMARRHMTLIATVLDYKSVRYGESSKVEDPYKIEWKWWEKLWPGHPFIGNGMNPHTLKWLDKIIPFLNSTGINYLVETINEFYVPDKKDHRYAWHQWLVNELGKRGIAKERLVTCARPAWRIIAEQGHYYSPHWIVNLKQWDDMEVALGNFPRDRVIPSGDGGRDGNAPPGQFGRGLGVEDARIFAQRMIDYGYPFYEYWDQTSNSWDGAYLAPVRAMKEKFDATPVPPEPEPPPIPPPTPPPTPHKTWWQKFVAWLKGLFH